MGPIWLARHGESAGNVASARAEVAGDELLAITTRDADTPLTDVGRRQAREVGTRLGLRNVGHALVSDALRTRQTWDCLQLDCPVEFMRALYYCGTDTVRQRIGEIDDDVDNLLIIAHASTIPGLTAQLAAMSGAEDEVGC